MATRWFTALGVLVFASAVSACELPGSRGGALIAQIEGVTGVALTPAERGELCSLLTRFANDVLTDADAQKVYGTRGLNADARRSDSDEGGWADAPAVIVDLRSAPREEDALPE